MKTIAILIAGSFLAGCTALQSMQDMTPEQIKEASRAKDANVVCTKATGRILGEVTNVYVNFDKGVVAGGIQVSPDCAVTIFNQ